VPAPAERQPAYALHRRAYRETSAIVDLLTVDFGRVSGVVRGVRGAARRSRPIDPFCELAVSWRGRGQLVNILRCEPVASQALSGERLFCGLYVNELLVKTLSQEEPVPALFQHYREVLSALHAEDASAADVEGALRNFERRLLEELGYGLNFDADVRSGRAIAASRCYEVVAGEGFVERQQGARSQRDGAPLALRGQLVVAMANGDYRSADVRQVAKRVFRAALQQRLGHRRLAARALFQARNGNGRSVEHG